MFAAQRLRRPLLATLLAILALSGGCLQEAGPTDQTTDAIAENTPPVADAGADQTAAVGDLVVLDGTGSSDADADELVYIWRQIGGEPEVTLQNGFSSRPSFFVPNGVTEETELTFRLTVVDGFVADFDDVTVTIQPGAVGG
jgi:hypothetical protein